MQNSLVHVFIWSLINYKVSVEHLTQARCLLGEHGREQSRRGTYYKRNGNVSFRNLETSAHNLLLEAVESLSAQVGESGS